MADELTISTRPSCMRILPALEDDLAHISYRPFALQPNLPFSFLPKPKPIQSMCCSTYRVLLTAMCRSTTFLAFCATCSKQISQNTLPHWCPEASRKGSFGRCLQGIRTRQEQTRDFDCKECRIQHEAEIDRKPLRGLAGRGLGVGEETGVTAGTGGDGDRGQGHKDGNGSDGDGDAAAVYIW